MPVNVPDNIVDAWTNSPGFAEETMEIEVPESIQTQGAEAVEAHVREASASQAGVRPEDVHFTQTW